MDEAGKTLQLQMMKRPEKERMIRVVKKYMDSPEAKKLLVHPYQENGKLVIAPIVLYMETGEMLNITLNEGETIYERDRARYR